MDWKYVATTLGQQAKRTSYAQIPHHRPVVLHACLSNLFLIESQHVVTEAVVSSIQNTISCR
jgi:hypothetical protein